MYWWNVSKLAEDFQQDRVDEKERFKYYLATSIVAGSISQLVSFFGWAKPLHLITAAVILPITSIGIALCYRANRGNDNADFIGRMVCLSWPVCIRLFVLCIIISFMVGFFVQGCCVGLYIGPETDMAAVTRSIISEYISFCYLIFGILYFICYYWMLHKYVKIIASSK